ncbi:hypothetical protein CDIK_1152 [Cucumispora dikerogammari]|nr:hypothetical protein CDIK_1152 [Cucumispora dikerogammari]
MLTITNLIANVLRKNTCLTLKNINASHEEKDRKVFVRSDQTIMDVSEIWEIYGKDVETKEYYKLTDYPILQELKMKYKLYEQKHKVSTRPKNPFIIFPIFSINFKEINKQKYYEGHENLFEFNKIYKIYSGVAEEEHNQQHYTTTDSVFSLNTVENDEPITSVKLNGTEVYLKQDRNGVCRSAYFLFQDSLYLGALIPTEYDKEGSILNKFYEDCSSMNSGDFSFEEHVFEITVDIINLIRGLDILGSYEDDSLYHYCLYLYGFGLVESGLTMSVKLTSVLNKGISSFRIEKYINGVSLEERTVVLESQQPKFFLKDLL